MTQLLLNFDEDQVQGVDSVRIEYSDGLLLASLTITYRGQSKIIDRKAIDTGAVPTIIVSDMVVDICRHMAKTTIAIAINVIVNSWVGI